MSDGTRARADEASRLPRLRRSLPYLLAALLVLGVKGLLVFALADVFFYGEVLAKGTVAKAILDDLPVPHYQLAYHYYEGGGFTISHLTALAFQLVGQSILAHELVSLCVNVAIALVGVAFVARNFGRAAAYVFALLYTLAPIAFQKLSLLNLGIHYESSLFLLLAFHFALRLALEEAPSRWVAAGFGLACGFGAFFSFQTLPASVFLVALVLVLRRNALRESRWLVCAWAAFVGALPFFWMWMSVGNAIFDVHGTPLFGVDEEEATSSLVGFVASLVSDKGAFGIALLGLRAVLPIAGAVVLARARRGRAATAALALLLYLAFFALVYAASPFSVGPFHHHFQLLRLTPFWIVGTVLTAGFVGMLLASHGRARALGAACLAVLVAAGIDASVRAIREGRPRELRANAQLLARAKGYSYPEYFAKFAQRLAGEPGERLLVLVAFDEPNPEIMRSAAAEALFTKSDYELAEVLALISDADPEHWEDYVLGLGPFCLRQAGNDVWAALGAAAWLPREIKLPLLEAIGRGYHWEYQPEEELARMLGTNAPDAWYRGVGYNLYLGCSLDPESAEEFIQRVPKEHREMVRAGYEESRRLNTLGAD